MEYLFQIVKDFWGFWFGGQEYAATISENMLNIVELLAVVTTIAIVMQFIVKPLFGILPWNKRD